MEARNHMPQQEGGQRLPISARLLCCAQMVPQGARVADVGCDHGYLSIHLLQAGIAASVVAADLRPSPLETARRNAARFGVEGNIRFALGDGLRPVAQGEADCVICAGMGGDTIANILEDCPWVRDAACTLVLQPQSSGNDLRRWLGQNGYTITRECPVLDGGRLYTAMTARFGGGKPVSPGREYVSLALLDGGGPLVGDYLRRMEASLQKTVAGLERSAVEARAGQLAFFRAALGEIQEMRLQYDNGSTNP